MWRGKENEDYYDKDKINLSIEHCQSQYIIGNTFQWTEHPVNHFYSLITRGNWLRLFTTNILFYLGYEVGISYLAHGSKA